MNYESVGSLIDGGFRVTRQCETCKDWGEVDLQRIADQKGRDYSMMDHLPLCTNGDCLGMIRFQSSQGMRSWWLLTAAGKERFQAHSDWMFKTRNLKIKREGQRQRRAERS